MAFERVGGGGEEPGNLQSKIHNVQLWRNLCPTLYVTVLARS